MTGTTMLNCSSQQLNGYTFLLFRDCCEELNCREMIKDPVPPSPAFTRERKDVDWLISGKGYSIKVSSSPIGELYVDILKKWQPTSFVLPVKMETQCMNTLLPLCFW